MSRPALQSQLPLRHHLLLLMLSLPFPPLARGSSYARKSSVLYRSAFYSVFCVILLLQCFPQLYCGNATSSCVVVPSLLYAISSVGELDPLCCPFLFLRCLVFLLLQPSLCSVSPP